MWAPYFHLVNVAYCVVFASFAICVGVSQRNWFLRTAVVCGLLLLLLLIPALDALIQLVSLVVTVELGIVTWKLFARRQAIRTVEGQAAAVTRARFQISLNTVLLLTLILAVIAAVARQIPCFRWDIWLDLTLSGVLMGLASLLCLWATHGRTRWSIR